MAGERRGASIEGRDMPSTNWEERMETGQDIYGIQSDTNTTVTTNYYGKTVFPSWFDNPANYSMD